MSSSWSEHLIVAPVVLPMVVGAAMLLISEERRTLKATLCVATTLALLAIALQLLHSAATGAADGGDTARVYALSNWAAPFGIVLVVDRLSAMMLALTGVLALGALLFALARWDRAGPRFYALFLLLLMGVDCAFLTGDLFNLFVSFEVMLAASYGLVLHGSGEPRIRAGLQYIAINLCASMCFLVGVSLIYGVTGTLNMAHLATRIAALGAEDRPLFEIGCAVLGVAFLVKAGMWPLGFWLPNTYAAASAPVAAVFAIMSKVGVYVVLRLSLLLFGADAGASLDFGHDWLLIGGLATIAFGSIGVLGTRELSRAAGYVVMISSGTVLAVLGAGNAAALSGALFYMAGSTLAAATLFLLAEILDRTRQAGAGASTEQVFADEYHDPFEYDDIDQIGVAIPAAVAALGVAFVLCAVLLAGLPPLAGFIGKLAIFVGLMPADTAIGAAGWALIVALTLSSLVVLLALVRLGIAALWIPAESAQPAARPIELVAIAGLLCACVALTLWGGAVLNYMEQTSVWLNSPQDYIRAVLPVDAR